MKIKKFNEGKNFDEFMKNHYGSYREYIESMKQKEGESEEDYIQRMKEYKKGPFFRNPYDDDYMDKIRKDDMRRRMEEGKKGKFGDDELKLFSNYKLVEHISRERITDIFDEEGIDVEDIKFTKSSAPHNKRFITIKTEYDLDSRKGKNVIEIIKEKISNELGYNVRIEIINRIGGYKSYGCDYDRNRDEEEGEGFYVKFAVRLDLPIVKNLGEDDDSQFEDDFEE